MVDKTAERIEDLLGKIFVLLMFVAVLMVVSMIGTCSAIADIERAVKASDK